MWKLTISKELLSEVLNVNVQTEIHEDVLCINNILIYWEFDGYYNECRNINIYELANKCKQWAIKNSYGISVHTSEISGYIVEINCGFDVTDFHNSSEPEAIFKACQWIMENKCGS